MVGTLTHLLFFSIQIYSIDKLKQHSVKLLINKIVTLQFYVATGLKKMFWENIMMQKF